MRNVLLAILAGSSALSLTVALAQSPQTNPANSPTPNATGKLTAQYKLPAVYFERSFADAGGLISYGPEYNDQYRRAAGYVDRILKGEKPADLPVQAPVKYETVLNMKTAKALGLDVPAQVLVRADEVIE
jgi:ABC-type uncharacterized transport system substrate-binding protein